jgi:hypothetical protein
LHGVILIYEPEAILTIAKNSLKLKLGARALSQIADECTKSVDYRLNELYDEGVRTITITADVIDGAEPRLSSDAKEVIKPNALLYRRSAFSSIDKAPDYIHSEEELTQSSIQNAGSLYQQMKRCSK